MLSLHNIGRVIEMNSDSLKCLSPEDLSILSTAVAIALAKDLDDASICILANLFFSIKVNLDLIAKQRIFFNDFFQSIQKPEENSKK